jgi:hypothetical protein
MMGMMAILKLPKTLLKEELKRSREKAFFRVYASQEDRDAGAPHEEKAEEIK